jgi:hypothetical protein
LKKFEGGNGWDFHTSEHRHQNDQPIPEFPELGDIYERRKFGFFGGHFLRRASLVWKSRFLPKKALEMEAILYEDFWLKYYSCK